MVTPYLTQHSPPAFVAALPPMEQISNDDGSGGYQKPCPAAAFLTSALNAPGCAMATRVTGSMVIRRIRSVDRVMPPSTAVEPPDRLEPAPRGTTGTLCFVAHRMTACTSSVEFTRTTASGVPASGSRAQSCR